MDKNPLGREALFIDTSYKGAGSNIPYGVNPELLHMSHNSTSVHVDIDKKRLFLFIAFGPLLGHDLCVRSPATPLKVRKGSRYSMRVVWIDDQQAERNAQKMV